MSELLTAAEVAKILRLSSVSVYDLIKTGKLPASRYTKRAIRVSRSDLEAFMASARSVPASK